MRSRICRGAHYVQVCLTDQLNQSLAPCLQTSAHFSPHLTHTAQHHCNWWIVQHHIKRRSRWGSPYFGFFPTGVLLFDSLELKLGSYCCWCFPASNEFILSLWKQLEKKISTVEIWLTWTITANHSSSSLCLATAENEGRVEGARSRAWEEYRRQTSAGEPNP